MRHGTITEGRLVRAATLPEPSFVTIPNIPMLSTGIEYPLMSGLTTFTQDDLRDIVASQDDPAIVSPRLKLSAGGEHGPAINEPAFGRATNLRLGDNDQTIYCDYVGVPRWLADVLPVAYPNRSIEGNFDVETVTGKKWRLVVTAVELLGVQWPGCSVLSDLPLMYGDKMPEDVTISAAINQAVAASKSTGGDPMPGTQAAVNVDDIRREYYDQLDATQIWWWIRAIQLEPDELIVDDDDGGLYRVPFAVSDEEISFDDPVEVKIEYVDVPESKEEKTAATRAFAAGLLAAASKKPRAVFATRAESRPVTATQEGGEVDFEALRQRLGLPEGSTEEQILGEVDRLKSIGTPGAEPAPGNNPMPDQDPANAQDPALVSGDPTDTGLQKPDSGQPPASPATGNPATDPAASTGPVTLDRAAYEALKAGAEAGTRVEASQIEAENTRLLNEAVKAGKFPPSRLEHYKALLASDRQGTTTLLTADPDKGGLAPGLVPVEQRGSGQGEAIVASADEGLPNAWFPEVPRIRESAVAAAQGRGHVLQAKEG